MQIAQINRLWTTLNSCPNVGRYATGALVALQCNNNMQVGSNNITAAS